MLKRLEALLEATLDFETPADFKTWLSIYIPGTAYSAMLDSQGCYQFQDIPVGVHNFNFEKSDTIVADLKVSKFTHKTQRMLCPMFNPFWTQVLRERPGSHDGRALSTYLKSDGTKTSFVKAANSNGLESSLFKDIVEIRSQSLTPSLQFVNTLFSDSQMTLSIFVSEGARTPVKMRLSIGAVDDSKPWEDFHTEKIRSELLDE